MIHYAWAGPDDDRTHDAVLDDLQEAGVDVADWRFFTWMGLTQEESLYEPGDPIVENLNEKDEDREYRVVAYTEGGEEFPDDFDEDKARVEFFKDIFRVHRVGV